MAKRKRPENGQISLGYPPALTDDLVHYWSRYKLIYPAFLILLVKGDYFITMDWDAIPISKATGQSILEGPPEYCCFPCGDQDGVFRKLTEAGFYIAICHPPEDPSQHSFT